MLPAEAERGALVVENAAPLTILGGVVIHLAAGDVDVAVVVVDAAPSVLAMLLLMVLLVAADAAVDAGDAAAPLVFRDIGIDGAAGEDDAVVVGENTAAIGIRLVAVGRAGGDDDAVLGPNAAAFALLGTVGVYRGCRGCWGQR